MLCWVDGQPAVELSVRDRGLAYGDGLFETIAVHNGAAALLERHLERLLDGARRLQLPVDVQPLRSQLQAFAGELGSGVVKLILTRGDGQRGYVLPQPQRPRLILQGSATPAYPPEHARCGVRLYPCATRLAEQPLLAGLKHLNRLEQVLARAEWQDQAFAEGLLRDLSGRVVEGVSSNLFLVLDGALHTPDLSRCGVAGVMRAEIIEQAGRHALAVTQRQIAYDELLAADEVFICNSLFGIWPVREFAGQCWPVGPLTRKLQGILGDLLDR
jgi:4-amino-4-deoxychorismate lyase